MKTFIISHKKLCIILGIILILILSCLIWIEVRIGFDNLSLNKISGTVDFIYPSNNSDDTTTYRIKLDDPSSWPNCEYANATYNIKDIKEGDNVYLLCNDWMIQTSPPYLTVFYMWKK